MEEDALLSTHDTEQNETESHLHQAIELTSTAHNDYALVIDGDPEDQKPEEVEEEKYNYTSASITQNDIKQISIQENVDEEKYAIHNGRKISIAADFVAPEVDDYMKCAGEITKCNSVSRIIYLLQFYKNALALNNNNTMAKIYEHINSLDKYTVSVFMEDWYHAKSKHFKTQNDYELFKNDEQINCENKTYTNCSHFGRYQRDRNREMYDVNVEIDHKNVLLRDQLDSIHTFIFHSSHDPASDEDESREEYDVVSSPSDEDESKIIENFNENTDTVIVEMKTDTIATTIDGQNDDKVWESVPVSVSECNSAQLLYIFNNGNVFDGLNKLLNFKINIIDYIRENKFDGNTFIHIGRKHFAAKMVQHCNDKKLRSQLGSLYTAVNNFDLSSLIVDDRIEQDQADENVWSTSPTSITDCNLKQIMHILDNSNVFSKLDRLNEHKNEIIRYIQQQDWDGCKLIDMKRKEFITDIAQFFNNNKLKAQLGSLYRAIINFDVTNFIRNVNNQDSETEIKEEKKQQDVHVIKNNKFVTLMESDNNKNELSYYAFGEQYRYTDNLREHPLYIKPKHESIKTELFTYFYNLNHVTDNSILLSGQSEVINSMEPDAQSLLHKIVNVQQITNDELQKHVSIKLEEKFHQQSDVIELVKLGYDNYAMIIQNIHKLCNQLPKHFRYFPNGIFVEILNSKWQHIERKEQNEEKHLQLGPMALIALMAKKKDEFCNLMKQRCKQFPSLQRTINAWKRGSFKNNIIPVATMNNFNKDWVIKTFETNEKELNSIIQTAVTAAIHNAVITNREKYIKYQNNQRCNHFIQKAILKSEMKSVKKLKAVWYHGINEYHEINVNDSLPLDHIIALICYTDISDLCTSFRGTYRRKTRNESIHEQKLRHAAYANMGRLMYEAFVFYASKDNQIQTLYHGISIPLVFPGLYCTFNQPTSTTTSAQIASNFCSGGGIVLRFESSESSKHIRTLDMGLFSCFDAEEEHLIFETR
eukprot:400377_1